MILDEQLVRQRIMPLMSVVIFFAVLNGVTFNIAIPDIAAEFSVSPSTVSWVITAYVVIFAFGSVVYARLVDQFSLRSIITFGLIVFCAGSLLGFFASSFPLLILARIIQAVGASGIPALGMLLATLYFPSHLRGAMLGVIASTVAFASGVGPVLGGFVAGQFHWHFLFLIPLVLLPVIPLLYVSLPLDESHVRKPFDFMGALLLGAFVGALLVALTQASWPALLLAAPLLAAAVWHMRRVEYPFIAPQLFTIARYRGGVIAALLVMATVFGMLFAVPIMVRQVYDLSTMAIGVFMFPAAMSAAVAGWLSGRAAGRIGSNRVVRVGYLFLIVGYLCLGASAGLGVVLSALCLIAGHCGFSIVHSSLAGSISGVLPRELTAVGMGFFNLIFFISGAFGTAATGIMLDILHPERASAYMITFGGFFLLALLSLVLFARTFPFSEGATAKSS